MQITTLPFLILSSSTCMADNFQIVYSTHELTITCEVLFCLKSIFAHYLGTSIGGALVNDDFVDLAEFPKVLVLF